MMHELFILLASVATCVAVITCVTGVARGMRWLANRARKLTGRGFESRDQAVDPPSLGSTASPFFMDTAIDWNWPR